MVPLQVYDEMNRLPDLGAVNNMKVGESAVPINDPGRTAVNGQICITVSAISGIAFILNKTSGPGTFIFKGNVKLADAVPDDLRKNWTNRHRYCRRKCGLM